jgi:four helix bundle protein
MGNFRELTVWKEAGGLAVEVYRLSARLPADERFGLTSQLRRAAVSVSTNIAEGTGRGSDKDLLRFLYISRGSAREVESLLEIATKLGLFQSADVALAARHVGTVSRMLTVWIQRLRRV